MTRNQISRVTGLITGHCELIKHLTTIGKAHNPLCACGLSDETGLHILCECPVYHSQRMKILGNYTLFPCEIPDLGPTLINRFLEGINKQV